LWNRKGGDGNASDKAGGVKIPLVPPAKPLGRNHGQEEEVEKTAEEQYQGKRKTLVGGVGGSGGEGRVEGIWG